MQNSDQPKSSESKLLEIIDREFRLQLHLKQREIESIRESLNLAVNLQNEQKSSKLTRDKIEASSSWPETRINLRKRNLVDPLPAATNKNTTLYDLRSDGQFVR